MVVNSCYELEKVYADHLRKVLRRKSWHIGPMFLFNRVKEEKAHRGNKHECLKWLDTKKPNSVVYVCFGIPQKRHILNISTSLRDREALGEQFIWVVRKSVEDEVKWIPDHKKIS